LAEKSESAARNLLDKVLAAKQDARRKLARLPFDQKIELVLKMQRDSQVFKAAKRVEK
jgi:hypothetical protein